MTLALLASVLFLAPSGALQWNSDYPSAATRRDTGTRVLDLANAPQAVREACGWYALDETPPSVEPGYRAVPSGYARTAYGYRQLYTIEPIPAAAPRRIYKYDLSAACIEYNRLDDMMSFIGSDAKVKWMWDAAEIVVESDQFFIATTNAVISSGAIPEAEVKAILNRAYELDQTAQAAK